MQCYLIAACTLILAGICLSSAENHTLQWDKFYNIFSSMIWYEIIKYDNKEVIKESGITAHYIVAENQVQ